MQVARILVRPRCVILANVPSCRSARLKPIFHAELGSQESRFSVVQGTRLRPCFSRLVSTITSRESRLKLPNPVQLTVNTVEAQDSAEVKEDHNIKGRNFGRRWICGLAVGSAYLSKLSGLAEVSSMEKDERINFFSSEFAAEWENRQSQFGRWIRRLWIPSLCVLTIALGWQYPVSLVVNVLFLMWSTKPSPSSIYMWVEERRQRETMGKRGLDRVTAEVSGLLETSAAVMHVEVRDHKIFCLARVTSLTKRSTMVGILGDWWVIYSSTSAIRTGVNMRSLMATVPPFVKEQFSIS